MNAKKELTSLLEQANTKMRCAYIDAHDRHHTLRSGHTNQEANLFINSLDFNYNNGFGKQNLYGTVWFTDGTWADRSEYDGSEWWEHRICPEVPDELQTP